MSHEHSHEHNHDHTHAEGDGHSHSHDHSDLHERKTRIVVMLTAITMVIEILAGYFTHSMALIAEGWHMTTHVFAIGLTWLAYMAARKYALSEHFSFRREKLLSLSGFTSAIILFVVAILVFVESIQHILNPVAVNFIDAIIVASLGLVVNAISAVFLHHDHNHSDTNIRAAYLHVLADALTSVTAIIALLAGLIFHISWMDSVSGIVGAIVITSWSYSLIINSGKELVDYKRNTPQ